MLGVCCHWLEERTKPKGKVEVVNAMDERLLQLGRYRDNKYTREAIKATYVNNAANLAKMLPVIAASGVRLFRISSALFPLADQVDHTLWDNAEVRQHLSAAGEFVKKMGMRVTTHPGQFCVLSSDSDKVVENAIADLSVHAWLFDAMGLDHTPHYAINIHGGKSDRIQRLTERIKYLPHNIRSRLTLENDETAYSLVDLLEVHRDTGVPLVWDSHHHIFNDGGISMDDAMMLATETWQNGIRPLQHISNTEPYLANGSFTDRRKHSDLIHYVPEPQLTALRENIVDCDVEAKQKNVAVMKMSADFGIPL